MEKLRRLSMREWVRIVVVASLAVAAVRYVQFAHYVETGTGPAVGRPTAADAFLPLGGIAALKVWLATGRFDTMHPAALVIVLATLLTAFVFRRALCSWLCPFGMVSEYLAALGRKIAGRNIELPRRVDHALIALKYAGTFLLLLFLFAAPASAALDFLRLPFYAVADFKLFSVYSALPIGLLVAVLGIIGASIFVKSFWCRYLCPYGALQGIVGVLSPIRLEKDTAACTGCGRCNRACPNCVDVASAGAHVVSAECMGCTSCVRACPRRGTLRFRLFGRQSVDADVFGIVFLGLFFGLAIVAAVAGHWTSSLSPADYRALFKAAADVRMPM